MCVDLLLDSLRKHGKLCNKLFTVQIPLNNMSGQEKKLNPLVQLASEFQFSLAPTYYYWPEENIVLYYTVYIYCSFNISRCLYYKLLIITKWVRPKLHYSTFNAVPDIECNYWKKSDTSCKQIYCWILI